MDKQIVDAINKTPHKAFIAVTGGGQNFIGDFLSFEGGSGTILGFFVPYRQELFDEFIQGKPDKYAGEEAARKLAVASYRKAEKLVGKDLAIGIGAASSVAAANEREGRVHKICVACQTAKQTRFHCYYLKQGRTRQQENELIENIILEFLAEACGVNWSYPDFRLDVAKGEHGHLKTVNAKNEESELIHGARKFIAPDDILSQEKVVIYCGSFNPFHEGHKAICQIAEKVTGIKPYVEITVANPDKGFIDYIEISNRVDNLRHNQQKVLLTNAPRYVDKLSIFPNSTQKIFVVGADTWERIWDTKYGVEAGVLIGKFEEANVKFLVFKRDGKTLSCIKDKLPASFYERIMSNLVVPCLEAYEFDMPISSSDIRKASYVKP